MSDEVSTEELDSSNEGLADEVVDEQPDPSVDEGADQGVETDPEQYTVKVDGEELQVSRDELVNGYQRQAHFTQESQKLAAERQELQAAQTVFERLREDPVETIRQLQEHFAEQLEASEAEGVELDPEEQRLQQVETFIEEQRQRELEGEMEQTFRQLEETYDGKVEDREGLLRYAIENQIGSLPAALVYLREELGAQAAAIPSDAEVLEQKRQDATSSGNRRSASSAAGKQEIKSVEDAWAAAKAELNWEGDL